MVQLPKELDPQFVESLWKDLHIVEYSNLKLL